MAIQWEEEEKKFLLFFSSSNSFNLKILVPMVIKNRRRMKRISIQLYITSLSSCLRWILLKWKTFITESPTNNLTSNSIPNWEWEMLGVNITINCIIKVLLWTLIMKTKENKLSEQKILLISSQKFLKQ